ncbi:apoptosis-stimulating of p53 protein 1-like isoform X2 [Lampetra fluviatilis]
MMPTMVSVFLSASDQQASEVPITGDMTCKDVVEACRPLGDTACHLVEAWHGHESVVPDNERMLEVLQRWGSKQHEVRFFLQRASDTDTTTTGPGGSRSQNGTGRRNGMSNVANDRRQENGAGSPGVELTLEELQEMATRQQQQIEAQQQLLVAKRLLYLKQQEARQKQQQQQHSAGGTGVDGEKLRALREKIESQEAKLRKIRAAKGQADNARHTNKNLAAEMEQVNALFLEKQQELAVASHKVEKLTRQLDELRASSGKAAGNPQAGGTAGGFQGAAAVGQAGHVPSPAAVELERLSRELQMRNKLNQEQNSRLQQQKDLLNKRNQEVVMMDRRISELRERLRSKKAAAQQKENIPVNVGDTIQPRHASATGGRVAAVGPIVQSQAAAAAAQHRGPAVPAKPNGAMKSTAPHGGCGTPVDGPVKPSSLLVETSSPLRHAAAAAGPDVSSPQGTAMAQAINGNTAASEKKDVTEQPTVNGRTNPISPDSDNPKMPSCQYSGKQTLDSPCATAGPGSDGMDADWRGGDGARLRESTGAAGAAAGRQRSTVGTQAKGGAPPPPPQRTSHHIQQRISVPPTVDELPMSPLSPLSPLSVHSNPSSPVGADSLLLHHHCPQSAAVRPFVSMSGQGQSHKPQSPRKAPTSQTVSSIYSMYTQQAAPPPRNFQQAVLDALSLRRGPGPRSSGTTGNEAKTVPPTSRAANESRRTWMARRYRGLSLLTDVARYERVISRLPPSNSGSSYGCHQGTERSDGEATAALAGVSPAARPLSPTKLLPFNALPTSARYQSEADLEALRRKLANAPRPLKKRSSITDCDDGPAGSGGPGAVQKILYQRYNPLAATDVTASAPPAHGSAAGAGVAAAPFYKPRWPPAYAPNGSHGPAHAAGTGHAGDARLPGRFGDEAANGNFERAGAKADSNSALAREEAALPSPNSVAEDDQNNNVMVSAMHQVGGLFVGNVADDDFPMSPPPPYPSLAEQERVPTIISSTALLPPGKRTNLKKNGSERIGHGMRVKFDPLAILLDAALEGDYELVQRVLCEVRDASQPNDEGITALHNAVCAGHMEIVRLLVHTAVNVNAADSDGWTPLHCAASCNNVHLCKFLVESGAAVFAVTISDSETAADKCEEMEEGYQQCSQFLYGVQEKLGLMNKCVVFALWDYEATRDDELAVREGDSLSVLRRSGGGANDDADNDNGGRGGGGEADDGGGAETEWWWARLGEREGFVPRNLLGLYPRIKPKSRSLA